MVMNYHLKRINPYWHNHPMIPTGVVVGVICAAMGFAAQRPAIEIVGVSIAGLSLFVAVKPVFSILFSLIGLFGGISTFLIAPGLNADSLTPPLKFISILLFTAFYAALMDAMLLVVAVIYNFLVGPGGLSGLHLELSEAEAEEETEG
jgi:hypothetical protein